MNGRLVSAEDASQFEAHAPSVGQSTRRRAHESRPNRGGGKNFKSARNHPSAKPKREPPYRRFASALLRIRARGRKPIVAKAGKKAGKLPPPQAEGKSTGAKAPPKKTSSATKRGPENSKFETGNRGMKLVREGRAPGSRAVRQGAGQRDRPVAPAAPKRSAAKNALLTTATPRGPSGCFDNHVADPRQRKSTS